ncbi:unnamed protein product [Callosobruchus maculatus]|uniref:CCHC-type domain-containing protein n=1 Tax=Callosobruchus maculatus TaxID=64391 RepID=A0A653BWM8_CALMS|nr:unnamed protein product [Callosobruchus maculatus]
MVKAERISFDLEMVYVEEFRDILICFRCCRFGHVARWCKDEAFSSTIMRKFKKKLRLAELTSDLQTGGKDNCLKKRHGMRPRKLVLSGKESESADAINTTKMTSRPPPIQLPQIISSPNVHSVEVNTLNTPSTSRTTYKSQLHAATSTEQACYFSKLGGKDVPSRTN